jgi:hypothetical protein
MARRRPTTSSTARRSSTVRRRPVTPVAAKMQVAAPIAGLGPATAYHYRLVAQNAHGLTVGKDRSFKTRAQPLGVTLAASPNPVALGAATTLSGILTGTGNPNRAVVLQANPFPYTQGFADVANSQLTNAQGGFAFPLPSVALNTQFRVVMTDRPTVVSPIVTVGGTCASATAARSASTCGSPTAITSPTSAEPCTSARVVDARAGATSPAGERQVRPRRGRRAADHATLSGRPSARRWSPRITRASKPAGGPARRAMWSGGGEGLPCR